MLYPSLSLAPPSLAPLTICDVSIACPVLLAPMTGVTDLPFRRLVRRFGSGLNVTEMIASEAAIRATRQSLRKAEHDPVEAPIAIQLVGCEPAIMAEAAKLAEAQGAAIIDINMGCPVRKVVNGEAGSALMRDLAHAGRLIAAVVAAVRVPVTVKMRTGWCEASRNAPELARIAEDLGARMVTVHGRTRNQMFGGAPDWGFVREVKQAVRIPVVVNGDITSINDVATSLRLSGADGVMIGRGAYGRPWLLGQVMAWLRHGVLAPEPDLAARFDLMIEHYEAMLEHYGREAGVKLARKHLGWYTRGLAGSAELRNRINMLDDPAQVVAMLRDYGDRLLASTMILPAIMPVMIPAEAA